MKFVFLDTNILMHFRHFEEIDWIKILNTSEDITIVIAPIVIDELDKHKYSSNRKVSGRVRKLLPRIEQLIDNPQVCSLGFMHIANKPSDSTFAVHNLDRRQNDDSLLATIIEFQQTLSLNDSTLYVTNDTGPRIKSRSFSINTFKPTEDLKLADELDELEKENVALRKELYDLKNIVPVVSLSFANNAEFISVPPKKSLKTRQEFIDIEMSTIKSSHPFFKPESGQFSNRASYLDFVENQMADYNDKLSTYFEDFENYLNSCYTSVDFESNCCKVELILANSGTAPADDIDVNLHFPDGFDVLNADDLPNPLKEPKAPYKPKHELDMELLISPFNIAPISPSINIPYIGEILNSNISKPSIKRSNSFDVAYHVKILKHNQSISLDPLYLKFEDLNKASGFSIDYKLLIANFPYPIIGKLHVKFE